MKKGSSGAFPMRTGGAQGFDMKANQSFWISLLAVVICGLFIAAFELGRTAYETVEVRDGSFWAKLWSSPPNEIGDTLAGLFGSLAFLAAALAVFLQTVELRAQRFEFEKQREATQDVAKNMYIQAEIFLDEQRQRKQIQKGELLEEKLVRLRVVAFRLFFSGRQLGIDVSQKFNFESNLQSSDHEVTFGICNFLMMLRHKPNSFFIKLQESENSKLSHVRRLFAEVDSICVDILELQYDLEPAKLQRLQNIEIDSLIDEISTAKAKLFPEDQLAALFADHYVKM